MSRSKSMHSLLVLGCGGHGKVAAETAQAMGIFSKIAFLDDRYPQVNRVVSWDVIGKISRMTKLTESYSAFFVAIGDNHLRIQLVDQLAQLGCNLPPLIHPRAWVSPSATIGDGAVVFAGAIINAEARMGRGCIVNTSSTIDHECSIGFGVHISPGANLGGQVSVGNFSWIGINASVIQCIDIGSDTRVGAGATVTKNFPSRVTVVGTPAEIITT